MNEQPVMVQIADHAWTLETLHLACALACQLNVEVVLVKFQPVQHLGWLGSDFGQQSLSYKDQQAINRYLETAEDYGVTARLMVFQYAILPDAISDVAARLDARIVFAKAPANPLLVWEEVDFWFLRRRLSAQQRALYTSGALKARNLDTLIPVQP